MLINEQLIEMNLSVNTKEEAIRYLASLAKGAGRINNIDEYVKAVLKREEECSTAVGFGVAIPHGKTDAVNEPFLGFAKVKDLDWQALDDNTVDIVFIIGVPAAQAGSEHLKILAMISRKLMKQDFREQLRKVETKEELLHVLEEAIG
ncbi:PTS sugar transporter subunit IIA [Vallitalea okinawensis]|uniref:PTS sugar transporter subunit IIA n=1 Tax=Vallitalea okinawensis TaxID=2078660 RepID=UPI000CFD494C|nr:fructose PTS transporter subunit IIA [Vallitalea okinawensis]